MQNFIHILDLYNIGTMIESKLDRAKEKVEIKQVGGRMALAIRQTEKIRRQRRNLDERFVKSLGNQLL